MSQQFYIVVHSDGNRYVHGPLNSDAVGNRVEILKRRLLRDGDDIKVISESEYLENDREYVINNTRATD